MNSSSASSSSSYSKAGISPWIFLMAWANSSSKLSLSLAAQAVSLPNGPLISFSSPKTMFGLSIKYWFIRKPSFSPRLSQLTSGSVIKRSLFCRKIISEVTSVPAFLLKVLLGRRIAPKRSALWAKYFLTLVFSLSRVPFDVIKATTPPGRTLSKALAKKKSWIKKFSLS